MIYKSLRNKVTGQLRKAKANFFFEIIRQAKGKSIDQLTGKEHPESRPIELWLNGIIQDDSLAVANTFIDYFIYSVLELGGNSTEIQLPMVLNNTEH